jgi:hypothetical protein
MLQLVYVSTATAPLSEVSLRALLAFARTRNAARGVTGMLLYQSGVFLQVLEGDRATVEATFAKIELDRRHRDVVTLWHGDIESRNFGDWSMGFVDVGAAAMALPGFRADMDLLDLVGDARSIERIVRGFRDGGWRQMQAT